jgi:hypothetical protein
MNDTPCAEYRADRRRALWAGLAAAVTLGLALSTLQTHANGSTSPYATDVGEIQNALPRWGTLHFTGYPLYSVTGSLIVTLLRLAGIAPAAGASLVSALWGAAAVGLLVVLAIELGATGPVALGGGLVAAASLSAWIDASLAEVHTMTMALTVAALLLALRYRRRGGRDDLLWLVLAFTQGVAHQRAVAFLAPALVLLIAPRWQHMLGNLGAIIGVALLAPLTYLYLPIRYWQGAEWTFGQPGTWRGFWEMIADTKAERILAAPTTLAEWWDRLRIIVRLVGADLPLPLMGVGLTGLWTLPRRQRVVSAGLLLAWLPYLALCVVIWEGDVSDALLAVKLPLPFLAGVGLSLAVEWAAARRRALRPIGAALLAVAVVAIVLSHRPRVLAITRDRGALAIVDAVAAVEPPDDDPVTLLALWGHEYWALCYAQAYEGRLPHLRLVDHNADVAAIAAEGHRLWTPAATFYWLAPDWWQERLAADVHLSSVGPGIVEIATSPATTHESAVAARGMDLGNGVHIASARIDKRGDHAVMTVYWKAQRRPARDYSVAVHLLAAPEPDGPEDIIAQADQSHPVSGWYPTSRWEPGEVVRDDYVLSVPEGAAPVGVRVGMYYQDDEGGFVNSPWLFVPW